MKKAEQSETTKLPSDDYIEHAYYRLGGELLFKCVVRKDIGDGDFQTIMDGVTRARQNVLKTNK